jgi:glycosyltransferase involved in cell wall biosynthesis
LRDHAAALEPALRARFGSLDTWWWERDPTWSPVDTQRSAARFLASLEQQARDTEGVVLWHYSPFEYGPRTAWDLGGLPVYAFRFARLLAHKRRRLLVILHDCAYAFSEPGWQRKALAAGHRAALFEVLRLANGIVIATSERERWLSRRKWLPRRPQARIPVCATLQPPCPHPTPLGANRIGVFGFGASDAQPALMIGATKLLRQRGHDVELLLLGAPGEHGPRADQWRSAARAADCSAQLSFLGVVDSAALSLALAGVDVVAFPLAANCGAEKTTLASTLAFAKPAVVLDGPGRWDEAIRAGALLTCAPTALALADQLEPLLADQAQRSRQGAIGRAYYKSELAPEIAARRLHEFAQQLGGDPR